MRTTARIAIPATVCTAAVATLAAPADPDRFDVRDGYTVERITPGIEGARFLEFDDGGTLYISRPSRGDIIAATDEDGDGMYDDATTFVSGHRTVQAMIHRDGWMWFTTTGSVKRARDTDGDGEADETVDVIPRGDLPRGSGHWWRSLLLTDEHLYTSIGDSGNITDERDTERQKIWRFDLDGSNKTLFCSGIRNTEELLLRPGTQEIWGFDHGSDWFGREYGDRRGNLPITDLNPPDELNRYEKGNFYGHPFIVGNRLPRPEYTDRSDIHDLADKTTPPEWSVPAHWAVNGFTFIDPERNSGENGLPASHEGDIFFAAHGSWNSEEPVGYCVGRILFDDNDPYGMLKIVTCLSDTGDTVARPVDVAQGPEGALYFSVDRPTGAVYRLTHDGGAAD